MMQWNKHLTRAKYRNQNNQFRNIHIFEAVIFSYLWNPFFTAASYRTEQKAYYLGLALIVLFGLKKIPLSGLRNARMKNVLLLLGLWIAVLAAMPFLHGTMDFTYLRSFRTIAGKLLACAAVIVILHGNGKNLFDDFCNAYLAAETFYVIMTAVIILFPPYRQWIKANIFMRAVPGSYEAAHIISLMELPSSFTRIGFDGFAIYGTGLKVSAAFALSMYMLYKNRFQKGYIFTTAVLFAGGIFYTRTGVLANICLVFIFIFSYHSRKNLVFYIKMIGAAMVFLTAGIVLFAEKLPQESVKWVFAMFLDEQTKQMYSFGGKESFFSTHIFIPRMDTLLAGNGYFQKFEGILYGHTDSGLMIKIIYHGLPVLVFLYICIAYMVFSIRKYGGKNEKLLSFSLLLVLAVFEVKGEAVMNILPFYIVLSFLYLKQWNCRQGCTKKAASYNILKG